MLKRHFQRSTAMRIPTTLLLACALCVAADAQGSDLSDKLKDIERKVKGEPAATPATDTASNDAAPAASTATAAATLGQDDAAAGIKEALAQGVQTAITQLGREDGFLGDAAVRIAAPKKVRKLVDAVRKMGGEKYVAEFETAMNRAAEKAVPLAAEVFADAVRAMTVQDALAIVRGQPDAATQYFRRVTGERLQTAFLPVVSKATSESGVARSFKSLNEKAGGLSALTGGSDVDLDRYVTDKAMDGLFHVVAEQEKAIRANPLGQASDLLRRVFGR
jgi:hypothetical protein